jgi:peptidoglycan hydrolase-like protein with peptidoglycan-binding domain
VCMKLLFALLFPLLFVFAGTPASGAEIMFTTTLSLGSSGPEVLLLQQVLNRDPVTRIATTGVGSPGNETSHFGLLTKAAIMRFQEKYASEVLFPAGLTQGTGLVGSYTRAKLNALSTTPPSTPAATTPATTSAQKSTVSIVNPDDYVVKEIEKIDLYAGDKMIAAVQKKMLDAVNAAITSGVAPTSMPTITTTDREKKW